MRILHSADWHLRDKDIEEAERCTDHIIKTAREQKVDLIAIAADIFDSRDVKLDSRAAKLAIKTFSSLADIAPVVVIVGTPSHDGNAPEILNFVKGKYEVVVATRPMQIKLAFGSLILSDDKNIIEPDAVITLVPTPTKQHFNQGSITESSESISQAMTGLFAGFGAQAAQYNAPHVLIGHWNVSGATLPSGQSLTGQDIDISRDQMNMAEPDIICLGHIHQKQQMGDRAFYSGSLYPLNWGEMTEHGFYVHTLGRHLVQSEYFESPCRKLVRVHEDHVNEVEGENIDMETVNGAMVRVDITAYQDEAAKIDKQYYIDFYKKFGALDVDVRLIRIPRQTVRSESVLKVETLRDKLVAMAELKGETVPESILQIADDLEAEPAEELIVRAA